MPTPIMSKEPNMSVATKPKTPTNMSVAAPSMSVAPKPKASLPMSLASPMSPVSTSAPAQQAQNQIKQKAAELAATIDRPSLPTSNVQPQAPLATQSPAVSPTNSQGLTPSEMGNKTEQDTKDRTEAAAVATPGVTQQGPGGFQAVTGAGDAQNKDFLDTQKKRDEAAATAKSNLDAAAASSGVSAVFDPELEMWVDITTGKPQLPRSNEPVRGDEKYGQVQGDMIVGGGLYQGLTTGQADAIEKAGADVQKEYDTALGKVGEQSRQDQANALIRGGQAGGLLNSQVTGAAAVDSVGGSWAGAGGSLKRLQDEYDQSIKSLKDEETLAINKARDIALTAARTGNAQYFDAANAAQRRVDEVREKQVQSEADYEKNLKSISEIQKLERSDATETISSLTGSGYDVDMLPEEYLQDLDNHLQAGGMPPGSARMLFATQKKVSAAKDIEDEQTRYKAEVDNAKNIVGILNDVPLGKNVNIGGRIYQGFSKGLVSTGTETDNDGNVTFYQHDISTGETATARLVGSDGKAIGKAQDGWETSFDDNGNPWRINAKTGQIEPFFPTNEQVSIQQQLPDGSVWMRNGEPAPECGQFVNDLTGAGVGNEKETKLAKCDPSIKAGSDNPPQVGDFFVQTNGFGWTGHIGVVAGVSTAKDGKTIIRALESNYPQKGQITSSRPVDAKNIAGFGRTGKNTTTLNGLIGGPDESAQGTPTFGGKKKEEDRILSTSEVKELGVPYGTTQSQAAKMGIVLDSNGSAGDKTLSPDDIKKYGLDPTDPENIGLTLEGAKQKALDLKNRPPSEEPEGSLIHVPTFEEFSRSREQELAKDPNRTKSPTEAELRNEYEEQETFAKSVKSSVDAITRGKFANKDERAAFLEQADDAVKSGNVDGLESILNQVAMKSMSVDQQNKYQSSRNLAESYGVGKDMLGSFASDPTFKTGSIKAIIEKAKKKGAFDADPRYTQLEQLLASFQNEYRNALFGASLTPGELAEANKVIVDASVDTPKTMWDKMNQGAKIQNFAADVRLADSLGMTRPKLAEYLK